MFFGTVVLWPMAALSLLTVYVNMTNKEISFDSLTKLNNRGSFDKYLYTKFKSRLDDDCLFLILIDVDNFKLINDIYGHVSGDEALYQLGSILKRNFNKSNAFIARYGGDEFAIVMECDNLPYVESRIDMVNADISAINKSGLFPYQMSISAGIATHTQKEETSIEQFIAAADLNMYAQKKEHKKQNIQRVY